MASLVLVRRPGPHFPLDTIGMHEGQVVAEAGASDHLSSWPDCLPSIGGRISLHPGPALQDRVCGQLCCREDVFPEEVL